MNRIPDHTEGSPGVMVTYSPSGEACFKLALNMNELGPLDTIGTLTIQATDSALLLRKYWQTSEKYERFQDRPF